MSGTAGFTSRKYISLETFRKSGAGVRTPVWFAAGESGRLYVYSLAKSGKAKRLRQSAVCRIAVCDARGAVTGPWVDARAEIVTGAEAAAGMKLLNRKYWPWKRMLDLSVLLFKRHERVVIAIRVV